MERSNLSQPMPATKEPTAGEELAEVDVDWLIVERPGKVKTLKQHPQEQTAINIEYMKASNPCQGGAICSLHHQAAVRLRESQIQGAA